MAFDPVVTFDDFGSYYHDRTTGQALVPDGQTGGFRAADPNWKPYQNTPVAPQWADLQAQLAKLGPLGSLGSSIQTGANDGWVVEWSQDPALAAFQQASVANPAGFETAPSSTQGFTPTIQNAHYIDDWAKATQNANDGGFMADYGWVLPLAIAAGGPMLGGLGGAGAAGAAEAATAAGALGESAALGSLGSGLSGVELAGAGLYGQTPLMAGSLGSGLAGTTAGTLGLDAGMLGAAGAGAAGAEALSSTSLPYGQTMAPVTDAAALSGGTPYTSSLDGIINNAISTGSQGYPYTDTFSAGSITGVSELGTPTGLYDYMASIGIDPAGLQAAAAGGAGAAPATWIDTLANLFTPSPAGAGLSAAQQLLSEQLGIPSNIAGGALGGLQMLAAILGRGNQANANNAARQNQYSASYTSPLSPKPWAGAGRGKPLGQVVHRADGGLTQMLGTNNAGPALGYIEGGSPGQEDDVQALLSSGEFVVDADVVSALGDGNNAAGARVLDQMRENVRRHKRGAPINKIPPKAKSIEQYLEGVR